MPPKKKMSPAPLPPPSLREELGIPPSVTDTEMQDLLRPPLAEMPMPEYTFGSQNIGPTAIRAGSGVVGGILQGVGGPLGSLGSAATTALGEDLAQRAEVYEGIRESPDLARVGTAGLMGAIPFPALRTATPLVREAGQAAFNTALPVGMVAAENAIEGRPQSATELGTAGGLGLLTHGAMKGAGVGIGTLLSRGHVRPQVAIEGFPMETALGSEAGAAVYHGTGATWPPEPGYPIGRPKLEHVRTGTGGMAQGHGFYVAQAEPVGEYYRQILTQTIPGASEGRNTYGVQGASFPVGRAGHAALDTAQDIDAMLAYRKMGSTDLEEVAKANIERRVEKFFKEVESNPNYGGSAHDDMKALAEYYIIHARNAPVESITENRGNLYTLDLPDEHLDKMLDWDKPISQQHDILAKSGVSVRSGGPDRVILSGGPFKQDTVAMDSGEQFYKHLSTALGSASDESVASNYLLSKGIIGNKYLDAQSRFPNRPEDIAESERALNDLKSDLARFESNKTDTSFAVIDSIKHRIKLQEEALAKAKNFKPSYNLVLFDPSMATPIARNNEPVPLSVLTGKSKLEPPQANLPSDVRHIGPWEDIGHQYNLKTPDGREATFTVPRGGDFNTELAKVRKRFGQAPEQGGLKDILGNQKGMAAIGTNRIFYRGTVPGETQRIAEPFEAARGKTFVARKPESARAYGNSIEEFKANPDAKILDQESPAFWKLLGKRRPSNSDIASVKQPITDTVNDILRKAQAAGYDAVSFSRDSDVGTVILNEGAFTRSKP